MTNGIGQVPANDRHSASFDVATANSAVGGEGAGTVRVRRTGGASDAIDTIDVADITGLVLAGGRGARMGGLDKGLQPFGGVPLAQRALLRLAPQVGRVAVNANRHVAAYQAFGAPVWPDADSRAFAGPLAGVLAGLSRCETPWLLTVPCDVPLFPLDLAQRLAQAANAAGAQIAIATAPQNDDSDDATTARSVGAATLRPQPVFCFVHVALRDALRRFLADGGRKAMAWAQEQGCAMARFDRVDDAPQAFANVNTLAELDALAGQMREREAR